METSKTYPGNDDTRSSEETQSNNESIRLPKADRVTSTPCRTQPPKRQANTSWSMTSSESWLPALEQEVLFAGTIVAQALHDGPWPSPEGDHQAKERTRHSVLHMSMIGASLRKFCQDTVLKTMSDAIRSSSSSNESGTETSLGERPFLGTLLMLRELLAQNYPTIFGGMRCRQDKEAGTFASRVMATSVILFALQQQPATERLTNVFLDKANEYDESRGSFAGLLASYYVEKEDESSNMREDSFALHVCQHPLLANHSTKRRKGNEESSDTLRLPEPNAVHITILRPTYVNE